MAEGRYRDARSDVDGHVADQEQEMLRARAQHRVEVVEALIRSIDFGWPLIEAIQESDDRGDAVRRLQEAPFSFSEFQANHVVDVMSHQRTRSGRQRLEDEMLELQAILDGA